MKHLKKNNASPNLGLPQVLHVIKERKETLPHGDIKNPHTNKKFAMNFKSNL